MTSAPASSSRAVFLDVDGTYAHHGRVPEAHVTAVRAARARGHLVFLCTGRPVSMLPPALTGAGFDGYVAGAGAYVDLDGEVLHDERYPTDLARRTLAELDLHGALYLLEAPDRTWARREVIDAMRAHRPGTRESDGAGHGGSSVIDLLTEHEDLADVTFAKVTSLHAELALTEIAANIGPEVAVIPSSIEGLGPGAGEMYLSHVNKSVGMRVVAARLGLAREQIVGVGDGLNDVEMLEYAGTGIAIEGSDPRVLAVADRTTPGPQRDGVARAFAELGLT